MNKIILTAATALLVSAGTAFAAGGDHFPVEPTATVSVDHGTTASISNGQNSTVKIQDSDRGVFGR